MFLKVQQYAYALLSALLVIFAFLLKIFHSRFKKAERQAEIYKAKANRARVIAEDDVKTEMDHQSRSAAIAKDVEEKKHADELSKPNEW